jgi:hypothetical protein
VIVAPDYEKIRIRFIDMRIEASDSCSKDYVGLEDAQNRIPVRHEVNSSLVISSTRDASRRRWRQVIIFYIMHLPKYCKIYIFCKSILHQSVKYCGSDIPHPFDSTGIAVGVKFKSDSDGGAPGFKMEYSIASK